MSIPLLIFKTNNRVGTTCTGATGTSFAWYFNTIEKSSFKVHNLVSKLCEAGLVESWGMFCGLSRTISQCIISHIDQCYCSHLRHLQLLLDLSLFFLYAFNKIRKPNEEEKPMRYECRRIRVIWRDSLSTVDSKRSHSV